MDYLCDHHRDLNLQLDIESVPYVYPQNFEKNVLNSSKVRANYNDLVTRKPLGYIAVSQSSPFPYVFKELSDRSHHFIL